MTGFTQNITMTQAQTPTVKKAAARATLTFYGFFVGQPQSLAVTGPTELDVEQPQLLTLRPLQNPLTVTFTERVQGGAVSPILHRYWVFGDGSTSIVTSPTHMYAPGTYTVSLTVTGTPPDGVVTRSKTFTLTGPTTVGTPTPPSAKLTANFTVTMGAVGTRTATFKDISTPGSAGPVTAWHWDFGDGNTSSSQNPSVHTYSAAGTYTVTLTVTGTGSDGTAQKSTTINFPSSGGGAGGTPLDEFISYTNNSRPSFSPSRTVQYHDVASFKAAISGMQAGDLIEPQPGCGQILLTSANSPAYTLSGHNPSSTVVIDLGTKKSVWDPGAVGTDYVKFAYTGSSNVEALGLNNCSKLRIYGGEVNSGIGGTAVLVEAPTSTVIWYDGYISQAGGSGLSVRGNTGSGANSACVNLDFRLEIARFCMNPAFDNHGDKGSGQHGVILHGAGGDIRGTSQGACRFAIYAHDPLRPGETSAGFAWPEGAAGSVCEQGNGDGAVSNYDNVDMYLYGENMLMEPGHVPANPGSTGSGQTGGNILDVWGTVKLNGNRAWLWGVNCTGAMLQTDNGSWFPGSPAFHVMYARAHNMNQWVHASNIAVPYPTTTGSGRPLGIVYVDVA